MSVTMQRGELTFLIQSDKINITSIMPHWISRQLQLFELLHDRVLRIRRTRIQLPPPNPTKRRPNSRSKITSDPFLFSIWKQVAEEYFPDNEHLLQYVVYWSDRKQLRTLASCSISLKKIRVAQELNYTPHHQWLPALLYHEMCHAVLGDSIRRKGEKTRWHGPEFRALEKQHPGIEALDHWIKSGGWATAVRSHRSRAAHAARRNRLGTDR